ncbi:hypothetical protein AB0J86_30545 [Micromonospora sp. NPDC049559]|uniref:hypothetical protein n=1 Tax=Micromonospora sp. NPDC049559 TaxID=3155923 RepID=UPI003433EE22
MSRVLGRICRIAGPAVLALACLPALAACANGQREIRTRCDGPNMVYESWRLEADDEDQAELELRTVRVVPNDPRCLAASPAPTAPPSR